MKHWRIKKCIIIIEEEWFQMQEKICTDNHQNVSIVIIKQWRKKSLNIKPVLNCVHCDEARKHCNLVSLQWCQICDKMVLVAASSSHHIVLLLLSARTVEDSWCISPRNLSLVSWQRIYINIYINLWSLA